MYTIDTFKFEKLITNLRHTNLFQRLFPDVFKSIYI
jgi:hypothetical protein